MEGQHQMAASTNSICLPEEQHVHVLAVAAVECCCSNSSLDTASAEPLKAAAAVLGSIKIRSSRLASSPRALWLLV